MLKIDKLNQHKTMANQSLSSIALLFTLITLTTFIPPNNATFYQPFSMAQVGLNNTQLTHLSFYWHNVVSGPNPTAVEIAKATVTDTSATSFGRLTMINDLLTEGPEPTSKVVGQAQGMYASADLKVNALTMMMNLYFPEGEFNGSTLSVLGRDPVGEGAGELPVVGGTGVFRFAKGYARLSSQVFDQTSGDTVAKYDVYVSHADSNSSAAVSLGPSGMGDSGSGSGSGPNAGSGSGTGSGSSLGSGSPSSKSSGAVLGQVSFPTMASILVIICCILLK